MSDFTVTVIESPALEVIVELAGAGSSAGVSSYDDLTDVPTTFPPEAHTHDDRYYTETEVDTALTGKASTASVATVQTNLDNHTGDTSDAHDASAISYAGGTGIAATEVEAALDELATEKANDAALAAHIDDPSDAHDASAISILDSANQYTATQVEGALIEVLDAVQAHEADTSDAHDATAISYAGSTNVAATDVEGAIDELDTEKVASTRSVSTTAPLTGGGDLSANRTLAVSAASETASGVLEIATQAETNTGTDDVRAVTPLKLKTHVDLHINDTSAAHAASAVSFSPTGTVAATDVQSAIAEVASEAAGAAGYRTLVTLGSDVSNSTSTFADVTGLSFAVTSGVIYRFEVMVFYTAQATTTGSMFSVNGPASPTMLSYRTVLAVGTATSNQNEVVAYDSPSAASSTSANASAGNIATIVGIIQPSASGTFAVRFKSEAPGTNNQITAKAGSTLEWW